ncbi:MAG: zinc-binding alcohol dehydrogenase family protein [Gaiellaceae bacterium]
MRGALVKELGRLPEPAEVDAPAPEPGRALVEIRAVPLNPIDIALAAGRHYLGPPPIPYVPGSEGVGVVLEGEALVAGTRVYVSDDGLGRERDGTLRERVTVIEEEAIPLPAGVSDEIAGACGIAGLAGWLPVVWRAKTGPGDRVLVLGATGTVGLAAVQAACIAGADRVVAAGRRPEGLERAAEAGADAVVRLDEADLGSAFREAVGGDGATVVIDPLWGEPLVAALEAAAPGARVIQIGQSAGATATIPSALVRGKQVELVGYSNFVVPDDVRREAYRRLVEGAAAGRITFPVETYPLERVAEAWQRQAEGAGVKLVVRV